MSKKKDTQESEPKSGGGLVKGLMIGVVLLIAGGGGTYGAIASGVINIGGSVEEDLNPQLVLKGEEDPYPFVSGDKKDDGGPVVYGVGGGKYRTAYYDFSQEFTSNLAQGISLIQVSLAASTQHDGRVLMWLREHETAVRSRILAELAATDGEDLNTVDGKERLQKRLTVAINEELEEREGFGGINNVYFRSLIVQ